MQSIFLIYLLIWALGIFSPAVAVEAKMYKWTDPQGQVHYTQSPPVGRTADVIKPPPKVDTESALKKFEEQKKQADTLREERLKKAQEKEEVKEHKAEKEAHCKEAQQTLERLTQAQRVFETDAQGYPVRIGEEERQAAIAETQKKIAEFCQ